jgi:hypothetical protein
MQFYANLLKLGEKNIVQSKLFFSKYYKIFSKPTLFLVIFFCIALLPLLRANVNYIDDVSRALNGDRGWAYLHSRWISEYASIFLHADVLLRDIAPFTQLIAVFLISLASVFLCWIVFDKKLTKLGILLSALLGVSPFFLECFAFKFDSPYMALSVLASVFPFLFAFKNEKIFALISFLSLLIMLTTYQLSSGIYIMLAIFLLFQTWNAKSKTLPEMWHFLVVAAGSYVAALVVFRFFLLQTKIFEYNTVFPIREMFFGVLGNYKDNFGDIVGNFNIFWIWILLVLIVLFLIKSVVISKQNKFFSLLITSTVLLLMFFFFQGFFIFVDKVGSVPRYFVGFNAFIALLALYLARPPYRFFAVPAVVLLYCFFIFTLMFGNALENQKEYKTFFATMLIGDLSKVITDEEMLSNEISVYFMDSIGNSPGVKFLQKDYPIIKHLIPNDFGNHTFGYTNLAHYNFPLPSPEKISKQQKQTVKELPISIDSYYYTIRKDDHNVYIWFNNR